MKMLKKETLAQKKSKQSKQHKQKIQKKCKYR